MPKMILNAPPAGTSSNLSAIGVSEVVAGMGPLSSKLVPSLYCSSA